MRITEKHLEAQVQRLNRLTGNPEQPYSKVERTPENPNGFRANVGNYHIDCAYGGVSLHQITTDGGGVNDVFRCGHIPKRELYERISAFIDGIQYAQDQQREASQC